MSTEQIVWTIVIVVVVLALVGLIAASMRKKSRQDNAARAAQLRQEADQRAMNIPEAQARAKEAEAQAEQARIQAERAEQRAAEAGTAFTQEQAAHEEKIRSADQLDPNVNTRSDDYTPDTASAERARAAAASPAGTPVGTPVGEEYDAQGLPIRDPHYTGPRFDADGRPIGGGTPEGGSHRA
ncbi:hypothetical protein [Nocardioides sp. LHG3406-4]|uniref:hypothetical protein n=1 Tax=Nocardioides sp. LHG3406-4 TaxID=2804575 RepID=UPI003CEE41F6